MAARRRSRKEAGSQAPMMDCDVTLCPHNGSVLSREGNNGTYGLKILPCSVFWLLSPTGRSLWVYEHVFSKVFLFFFQFANSTDSQTGEASLSLGEK